MMVCGILALAAMNGVTAKGQQSSSGVLTLKSNSQLVFMDVTVLDRKGHPVVKGLTRDDFSIIRG